MDSEHIPIEAVKAYLLGQLADEEAAVIEKQYFLSPACLVRMREAERTLIANYLDGVLAPDEARQFESRYLRLPALKRVVNEVKRERAAVGHPAVARMQPAWLVWAGALLCAAALCIWIYRSRTPETPRIITSVSSGSSLTSMTLRLTPGVTKGGGRQAARMDLPREHVPVKLIAELSGLPGPVECGARLSVVGPDGGWAQIWSSGLTRTTVRDQGQELTLLLNSSLLSPGDYILEVTRPDGAVRAAYLFHVSPPR